MLKDIDIKPVYNSEDDNILKDFYIPVLSNAITYDRAAGYFDAKVLCIASKGLSGFVAKGGYIRLIVGATLSESEYDAIITGYAKRQLIIEKVANDFEESLDLLQGEFFKNQLSTLTWFIQNHKLDIKVALRKGGIYHEKIGILKDAEGNEIVFQGSVNETSNALTQVNYESINVFKGWLAEFRGHIDPHIKKFEALWTNSVKNTRTLEFTEITKKILTKKLGIAGKPTISKEIGLWQEFLDANVQDDLGGASPCVPIQLNGRPLKLRDHQLSALNNWKENEFKGIFELATGAGKTITAIYGAVKLYESYQKLFLVISVPYISLADQWDDNLRMFNIKPIMCYGGEHRWYKQLNSKIIDFNMNIQTFVAVVVVDATLNRSSSFLDALKLLGDKNTNCFMFVGDECHHHASQKLSYRLPKNATFRIGLSATPDKEGDIERKNLESYYGKVVAKYTLEDALYDGVLTPYEYYVHQVTLTPDESEQYIALSKKIARIAAISNTHEPINSRNNNLNSLLRKRARLISGCQNKPRVLKQILQGISPIKYSLFYCAEGGFDDGDSEDALEGKKNIQVISELLHSLNWRASQFTANEDKSQRELILRSFKEGKIHSLVAMKCLDEGIDVPACSTAFILASSRQPRQFIQRRGRILRKSPGKEKAIIHDFFVTLPVGQLEESKYEKRLLIAELKRIDEFSRLALNKGQTFNVLKEYLQEYDLLHYLT